MSESGFSKYFVKASNMTFTEMVRGLRLSQACRILARDDVTIASVSQQVGYTNLSNFNRQFMREYGLTPSAYRRRERNSAVKEGKGADAARGPRRVKHYPAAGARCIAALGWEVTSTPWVPGRSISLGADEPFARLSSGACEVAFAVAELGGGEPVSKARHLRRAQLAGHFLPQHSAPEGIQTPT